MLVNLDNSEMDTQSAAGPPHSGADDTQQQRPGLMGILSDEPGVLDGSLGLGELADLNVNNEGDITMNDVSVTSICFLILSLAVFLYRSNLTTCKVSALHIFTLDLRINHTALCLSPLNKFKITTCNMEQFADSISQFLLPASRTLVFFSYLSLSV